MKATSIFTFFFLFCMITTGYGHTAKTPTPLADTWERLGTRTVDLRGDHDEILVTASEGRFQKLKFDVRKSAIFIKNITVVFGSGADRTVAINKRIPAGSSSRIIDLPGNKRIIKKIKFNYRSLRDGNGKAILIALGRH